MKTTIGLTFFVVFLIFSFQVYAQNSVKLFVNNPCGNVNEPEFKYDAANNLFLMRPNPTHGEFNLVFVEIPDGQAIEISISNIQGNTIWQNKINSEEKDYIVNLTSANAGVYFVTVNIGELISHKKLIIY